MVNKDKLYNTAIINSFKIKSDSIEVLKEAVKIAFSTHTNVIGFTSTVNTLTLFWKNYPDIIKFNKSLNEEMCYDFIYNWLMNIDPNDRLKEESDDGDYGFGFKISSKGNDDVELFHIVCMNLNYNKKP